MVIKGKKVLLRGISKEDINDILEIQQESEGMKLLLGNLYPININSVEKWIESLYPPGLRQNITFGIARNEDNKIVGYISLKDINYINRTGSFGIVIKEKYRGQGIAKEATLLFFNYLKHNFDTRKINLTVISTNQIAIDFYTKLGFKIEGTLEKQIYFNGKFEDLVIMSKFL